MDLFAFGERRGDDVRVGAGVDYSHRLSEMWSAIVRAELGYEDELQWRALVGIRGRW